MKAINSENRKDSSIPLCIDRLGVAFRGKAIFQNLSLDVAQGEFVTIMGENGAGKTVLIEALMGYIRPSHGRVSYWGSEFKGQARRGLNNKIGWVLSHREDYPVGLTVKRFLDLHAACYATWDAAFVTELLAKFQLDIGKQLLTLSLGEQSKVKLIKALAFNPEMLVLDELTANLSPDSKQSIIDALIDRFSTGSLSVVYISHSDEEALRLSDRIFALTSHGLVNR